LKQEGCSTKGNLRDELIVDLFETKALCLSLSPASNLLLSIVFLLHSTVNLATVDHTSIAFTTFPYLL